ncbi:hypothetical protein BBP40_012066 [Aspergillus hancockii]|nr:hypothetical protein BBP40_012066 [Aspergillus hancockii]
MRDTFKLKADFARSQCLGGLNVWAVSHDHENGTYSRAIGTAAQRNFIALADNIKIDDTGHGEARPDGYSFGATMMTKPMLGNGCWMMVAVSSKGRIIAYVALLIKAHLLVTGTLSIAVIATGNVPMAACCTKGQKSTALYEKCEWGALFDCDSYKCPSSKLNLLLESCNGNGGSACAGDWKTNLNEERKYCCDSGNEDMTLDDCTWEDHYRSTGYNAVPEKGGSKNGYCFSNCPSDKVRVEHYKTCSRKTGSRAKCCSPNYTTTTKLVDPMVELWESDL